MCVLLMWFVKTLILGCCLNVSVVIGNHFIKPVAELKRGNYIFLTIDEDIKNSGAVVSFVL